MLSPVKSLNLILQGSSVLLHWMEPFTLDITDLEIDITGYCVEVVNLTSSAPLYSECGITATQFDYPISPVCTSYNFSVQALNVVGSGEPTHVIYCKLENGK